MMRSPPGRKVPGLVVLLKFVSLVVKVTLTECGEPATVKNEGRLDVWNVEVSAPTVLNRRAARVRRAVDKERDGARGRELAGTGSPVIVAVKVTIWL